MDLLGLEPRTYRMLSDRSTTGAPNPDAKVWKFRYISCTPQVLGLYLEKHCPADATSFGDT